MALTLVFRIPPSLSSSSSTTTTTAITAATTSTMQSILYGDYYQKFVEMSFVRG